MTIIEMNAMHAVMVMSDAARRIAESVKKIESDISRISEAMVAKVENK